jgi:hypothetical protein
VATPGLSKEEIRRLVLRKLQVVYRGWGIDQTPFARAGAPGGPRRDDARAFVVALVAALLGGLSEAIERNTRVAAAALRGNRPGPHAARAGGRGPAGRASRRRLR